MITKCHPISVPDYSFFDYLLFIFIRIIIYLFCFSTDILHHIISKKVYPHTLTLYIKYSIKLNDLKNKKGVGDIYFACSVASSKSHQNKYLARNRAENTTIDKLAEHLKVS